MRNCDRVNAAFRSFERQGTGKVSRTLAFEYALGVDGLPVDVCFSFEIRH